MVRIPARLSNPTPQQLFDLCLLGMAWLRDDQPDTLDRLANSVMTAMRNENAIAMDVLKGLGTNFPLITLARNNGQDVVGAKRPPKHTLEELVATSDKFFLYVRFPIAPMSWPGLFAPRGYPLVLTEAGIQYITPKALEFTQANVITKAGFIGAWRRHARSMRGLYGTGETNTKF